MSDKYKEPFMQCFEELQCILDLYWPEGRDEDDFSTAKGVLIRWSVLYDEADEEK